MFFWYDWSADVLSMTKYPSTAGKLPQLRGRWGSRWARRSAGSCGGSQRYVRPSEAWTRRTSPSSSSDRASHSPQYQWPYAPIQPGWCQLERERDIGMLMVLDTALNLQVSHLQLSTHSAPNVFNPVSIYHVWRSSDFPPTQKKQHIFSLIWPIV